MPQSTHGLPNETIHQPTLTDMISLQVPTQVKLSPNGRRVAYAVRRTNWNKNRYERFCFVHDLDQNHSFQLTRSGNVEGFEWIDDHSLAVAKSEDDGDVQIWLFEHLIGEGVKITEQKKGVGSFKPFAEGILFLANDPERMEKKARTEEYGTFTHFEQEDSASALYYVSFEQFKTYQRQENQLTEDKAKELVKPFLDLSKRLDAPLKINDFVVSPQNDAIYLNCRSRDDLVFWDATSTYQLLLDPEKSLEEFIARERSKKEDQAERAETKEAQDDEEDLSYLGTLTQIALPKGAAIAAVSPDGSRLLVNHKARDNMFYTQADLWILDLADVEAEKLVERMTNITGDLDQEILYTQWVDGGIFVGYASGTRTKIAQLTESGKVHELDFRGAVPGLMPSWQFHASKDGLLGFIGTSETTFPEVFIAAPSSASPSWELKSITSFGDATSAWDLGTVETIRWISRDGTEIEGVLRKPQDFDPNQKYPLVFVVHGGPSWFSAAELLGIDELAYYPSVQFNHRGILVLKPNYRGSIGRGQGFLELNKNNLGIGDLEDLESAIEYLETQGYVDTSRVGCMGWSQGGYISAFAGTHSNSFCAVSVGAGVSDWYTYHIANDIPQFTTHYLSGTPFKNRELYVKTAPMSKIQQAKTPALIQHGAKDQRVPLTSATELYRGLKDMGVPVELFVYPEMAHPITKPRENRAIMFQNLTWFSHYLLGEELDFFKVTDDGSD